MELASTPACSRGSLPCQQSATLACQLLKNSIWFISQKFTLFHYLQNLQTPTEHHAMTAKTQGFWNPLPAKNYFHGDPGGPFDATPVPRTEAS